MLARLVAALVLPAVLGATSAGAATDDQGRTVHTVYAGQTLAKIAKRYNVSVDDLRQANGLRHGARIQSGQKLIIPDGSGTAVAEPRHHGTRWQDYVEAPRHKGVITLQSPTKRWSGYVLTRRGKVLPRAQDAIERMLASWRTGNEHDIDDRLIRLVVQVSDTFGGRPIRVVSGYREHSFAVESKHKVGRAFDFSIPGIPNAIVRDYLRTLPNVGVGYYPNVTHVHLDVREASAYWVDDAGPGEPPQYAHGGTPEAPSPEPKASTSDDVPADVRVE
jgi:uncharacterized protein YcbK (DUF882 family)